MILGEVFGLFVLFGSILYPKATDQLPTSIDGCHFNATSNYSQSTISGESMASLSVAEGDDNFLFKIFHMAFLLVPVSGFLISYFTGILVSLATGGLKIVNDVNPLHLNPIVWHIWPKSCVPESTRENISTD